MGAWAHGSQNVQIEHVARSSISIVYDGQRREVPLEPAVVPVGVKVRSPARLVRARSGVIPYSARTDLLDELEAWAGSEAAFASCVVGGRGGTGKTRLGVELCERAHGAQWVSGMLSRSADPAALEALVQTPSRRLVVVDYAETRLEQLGIMLPLLAAHATTEHSVRVLLLVRAEPQQSTDWTERLRHHQDALDALLDDTEVRLLEDMPLAPEARADVFRAAAGAFAARKDPTEPPPAAPPTLADPIFATPLHVVIGAYLSVHGDIGLPTTRAELIQELLHHEDRYWRAGAGDLLPDPVLRARIVALASLAGADSEAEAAELLRLIPDLADGSSERRASLARWFHSLYPGDRWWNSLEPDLLAEHLVAECLGNEVALLLGVLRRERPDALAQPLAVLARTATDHRAFAEVLGTAISSELPRLCASAIEQAAHERDLELLLGDATLAAGLDRLLTVTEVEARDVLPILDTFPDRPDLILSPLALSLTRRAVAHFRQNAEGNLPQLATTLNNLSNRLAEVGRLPEALDAIVESVAVRRRLVGDDPASRDYLAASLNNLSNRLADLGRWPEALEAITESVELRRRLAQTQSERFEPGLAISLINLSNRFVQLGRHSDALKPILESIQLYERLAKVNPARFEPALAGSLNNLSVSLTEDDPSAALAAIEKAIEIRRRLAASNPAAHEQDFAASLNNLSNCLAKLGREPEALEASTEAATVFRRLAKAKPTVFEPELSSVLTTLSDRLAEAERQGEAVAAVEEALAIRRRLAEVNPGAFEPSIAATLDALSNRLAQARQPERAVVAAEEARAVWRQLAERNPDRFRPTLAASLNNALTGLVEVGRLDDALTAVEEAVGIYRDLASKNPAVHEPKLVIGLENLATCLDDLGRVEDARRARQEAARRRDPS